MALNDKQKRFCEEYVVDFNGSLAATRAGYSEKTARSIASELLTKPDISEYIKSLQQKLSEKTGITAEMVVNELIKIGFANIQDYIDSGNSVKDLSSIEASKAAAISSVKKSTTHFEGGSKEVVEFKLWDKKGALESLGKHLGIFEKDNEQQKDNCLVIVRESKK